MKNRSAYLLVSLVLVYSVVMFGACGGTQEPTSAGTSGTTSSTSAAGSGRNAVPGTNATPGNEATGEEFIFGMIMVGPYDDAGWSQSHYEGARYAESKISNSKFIFVDKVNAADRPGVTVEQLVDDLVAQGARLIIANSDDFKESTRLAAQKHPDIIFIHISGDDALTGLAPPNLGNIMGKMIYGKMIAGCAAVLKSETGSISYLGPLINHESRRQANAVYLGARYCNENVRDDPFEALSFEVVWIGFWLHIPGVTLDPTEVARDFITGGSDVIVSGIDTTEALVEARKATEAGTQVYAVPFNFKHACEQAEDVCVGVPYFNWGPAYVETIKAIRAGTWESSWDWNAPDWWNGINNSESTAVGFVKGQALGEENSKKLERFIDDLTDGSVNLFIGPLNYQDGSVFLEDGEVADDETIWFSEQLLEGMTGDSFAE